MNIEQEICMKIDYGEVIGEFNVLGPVNRRISLTVCFCMTDIFICWTSIVYNIILVIA